MIRYPVNLQWVAEKIFIGCKISGCIFYTYVYPRWHIFYWFLL